MHTGMGKTKRGGFTLIEALAAIALAAIAGSALLYGTTASIQNTDDTMRRTIAYGMAQQLMDEVVGCRYMELGGSPYDTTLGPSASEAATGNRSTVRRHRRFQRLPLSAAQGFLWRCPGHGRRPGRAAECQLPGQQHFPPELAAADRRVLRQRHEPYLGTARRSNQRLPGRRSAHHLQRSPVRPHAVGDRFAAWLPMLHRCRSISRLLRSRKRSRHTECADMRR